MVETEIAFRAELIDRVLFSRWVAIPTPEDVVAMEFQLAEAMQRLAGPVIYVATLDARVPMPNAEARLQLNRLTQVVRRYCEQAHVIVEGDELQRSMQRLILSGMMIATRAGNDFMSVHPDVDSAAQHFTNQLRLDGETLMRQARELGLLE
jgi:hypothetical protein